jgi:DNA-binding winged helix-turn-helix (wHTH) protein/TolB-like protein/Tfp pilus assembly protein PilF
MKEQQQRQYEFGPFLLDGEEGLLLRNGERVSLRPKAFETLVILVERSNRLVEKDELMRMLWPDSFVEEANLTNNIWALRKVLDINDKDQSYIETVPKRGYRFTSEVHTRAAPEPLIVERHVRTRIVVNEEESEQDVDVVPTSVFGRAKSSLTKRALVSCSVALCLLLGLWVARSAWRSQPADAKNQSTKVYPGLKSIAVLPVKPIGAESTNEYLSIGLADALITRLGNVEQLIVRPTSAVRRYTDANQDPVTIGRQQNVDAVLDGSFQRTGDRIRLTVQLIRVSDRSTIWASQFDEKFTDIFSVQDSISERVACDLITRICGGATSPGFKEKKIDVRAYEAYLKGRYFWNRRSDDGYRKAVESFRQAIAIDPSYARAYAGLGDAFYFLGGRDREAQDENYSLARAALKRALDLDEALSEPHATLGLMAMNNEWNWPEAERQFKRAIELSPNYATAHQWYGEFLAYMGRFDEAIASIERARTLDPLSLIISTDVAKVYMLAGRRDQAIAQFQKTLELDPNFDPAHAFLGITYTLDGQHEQAVAEYLKIKELQNGHDYLSFYCYSLAVSGDKAGAKKVAHRLGELSKRTYISAYWRVYPAIGLRDHDEAFRLLDEMVEERSPAGAVSLKVNPAFAGLRSDPRYDVLLRRTGF